MAELHEEITLLERQTAEEARQAEEKIAKEAEEARLVKMEVERVAERVAEEERKRKEEEEQRQVEEQKQVAITLAEYQKNMQKVEAEKIEAAADFKKRENEVLALLKAKAKVAREAKAKAKKEVAAAKKAESGKAEGSKKWGREEREISVTVGLFLTEHGW